MTGEPTTVEFTYGDARFPARVYLAHAWRVRAGYLGLKFEDVTERRRVERLLETKLGELERSNAELERFATVASHDLQEPLRTIASFADLLARDYASGLDDKGHRYLTYVREGAARLQHVLDALLDYARITSHPRRFEKTSVAEAVECAKENLRRPFETSGAILEAADLPEIEADPHQLTILFQNLFSNSIRFGGDAPPRIEVTAQRDGHDWRFCVRDQGIGFPAEYASRVFEMFRRLHAKEDYPGTGVGLASCKKIVEGHGGKMWAESSPGEGAAFHFTLPESHPHLVE
jgi:light-regulated signal transduction histidine kinase (bacteriophytochrome)